MRPGVLCGRYFVTRIVKNVSALCYRRDGKKRGREKGGGGRKREKERKHAAGVPYFISRADVAAVFCVNERNEPALVY